MAPAKTNRLQVSLHSHLDWISKLQMAISPLALRLSDILVRSSRVFLNLLYLRLQFWATSLRNTDFV